ncbi:MAG: hypothetical protein J6T62_04350 [Fibrobacter sp.]|nr:hypothetical protein [Fibrobacter sp.]MBO7550741.1 hypothetical protein [Fibrobacter sp.]
MNETTEAIKKELTLCYMMAHKTVPTSAIEGISSAIADAVPAITADNAHAIFRRALQVEAIPTVPTLVSAAKNHMAESYGERGNGVAEIEYRDPRAAWLPKNPVMRAVNRAEAVKNYCIACGGNAYWNLCAAKARGKEAYEAFVAPIRAAVTGLYAKYWRRCAIANGYPSSAGLSLSLIPATVEDFRKMFAKENAGRL